ncbi:hypothetical protein Rsub_10284 [Raphidocelis subcapitata]|uniref:3'-5' exonuclease domain-containing protein n=1 Tax=Raphidocelis subcapitata TaxID=307507 RepID=A0A2V0PDY5_9CHLO|nr:hypothetical protein Rsub_10284 [Raphidocelis subcapitata]|eukprot:GBF98056.1 hypothetical protein Rsub_10284 [Raphidocelis subcapitata]
MLSALEGVGSLAVDAEGCSLSRRGKLCLLQICAPGSGVWLVDVTTLGKEAFTFSVKGSAGKPLTTAGILEERSITKLMYDARQDSEALWHQHSVFPRGVYDLQLAVVAALRANGTSVSHVIGLRKALDLYVSDPESPGIEASRMAHMSIKSQFDTDPELWDKRPLSSSLQDYAATDVQYMHLLRDKLTACLPADTRADWVRRIKSASAARVAECKRVKPPRQGRHRAYAPKF